MGCGQQAHSCKIRAMIRSAFFLPLIVLACGLFALPQNNEVQPEATYKLLSIHVKGTTHLSSPQVIQASGLQLGHMAGEEDFKQALSRLGDTGLFANLSYSYRYSSAGCDLELQVSESDKFLAIEFDNLVWFSDKELLDLLRTRVPLFEGQLPSSGNMAEEVSQALSAILAERKIPGQVEYLESGPMNGPVTAYTYKVTFHSIAIRNADFPGAAPAEMPALQAAAKQVIGKDYLRSSMRAQEQFSLLPVYLARGYLKASFADSRPTIVQDGPQTVVDVGFPVTPGVQYKLSELEIGGYKAFPVESLRNLIHLKSGEPANAVQLEEDLRAVRKLYGTRGYLAAQVQAEPVMDDISATVRYRLSITEGDQFHMGELKIEGLSDEATARLAQQWQIEKGDVFDESYLARFLGTPFTDANLQRRYTVVPKQQVDSGSKTVNVLLTFVPKT